MSEQLRGHIGSYIHEPILAASALTQAALTQTATI